MSPPSASNGTIAAGRGTTAQAGDTGRSIAEWLVIGGSTLAIVSFVLPWATDGVLGSNGIGYTAQWGLANGGHLVLIVATSILLLLHLGSTPVPGWIRTSVLPLAVGGLLAGLAFAYYARPFGGGTGVAVLLAGAVLLLVGGVAASRPGRNVAGVSSV
jgi:Flp pilus assembly protein TadB